MRSLWMTLHGYVALVFLFGGALHFTIGTPPLREIGTYSFLPSSLPKNLSYNEKNNSEKREESSSGATPPELAIWQVGGVIAHSLGFLPQDAHLQSGGLEDLQHFFALPSFLESPRVMFIGFERSALEDDVDITGKEKQRKGALLSHCLSCSCLLGCAIGQSATDSFPLITSTIGRHLVDDSDVLCIGAEPERHISPLCRSSYSIAMRKNTDDSNDYDAIRPSSSSSSTKLENSLAVDQLNEQFSNLVYLEWINDKSMEPSSSSSSSFSGSILRLHFPPPSPQEDAHTIDISGSDKRCAALLIRDLASLKDAFTAIPIFASPMYRPLRRKAILVAPVAALDCIEGAEGFASEEYQQVARLMGRLVEKMWDLVPHDDKDANHSNQNTSPSPPSSSSSKFGVILSVSQGKGKEASVTQRRRLQDASDSKSPRTMNSAPSEIEMETSDNRPPINSKQTSSDSSLSSVDGEAVAKDTQPDATSFLIKVWFTITIILIAVGSVQFTLAMTAEKDPLLYQKVSAMGGGGLGKH